ncbi:YesN/AraC family two-component response regulator [Paenibacillus endophyticus]|uniref:YesN/AraC family two-component response regulator n=1 Tax=Paenibacillus endophyticus TaxID=1294268 RepID=A0A7W5CAX3_9BACL|nr:AraC family transcriptional regulator [Paenibacillus endophyticus]MBB3153915.1 YesN/AraC family two-component response regulator [Paenibacillus endophyticus]
MTRNNLSLYPILSHHKYWNSKADFQLNVDTYELWVMFAVESGSFSYRIGEVEGTGRVGDVIVCPPGLSFQRDVTQVLTFHFIGFSFSSLAREAQSVKEQEQELQLQLSHSSYKLSIKHRSRLADNMDSLKQQSSYTDDQNHHWKNHLLNDIWQFCRQVEIYSDNNQDTALTDSLIEQAKAIIHQHCFQDFSMHHLAVELGISPVQLSRRFQRSLGITPSRYLTALRIDQVKLLLTETQLSLEQIAQASGYSNGFYLSRIFSKNMKVSPSEFRKMNRV